MLSHLALTALLASGAGPAVSHGKPLHVLIDQAIEAAPGFKAHDAGPAEDAELCRRLHLDLIGRIPSVREAREFLDDRSQDKRQALISRLLSSPEHARWMATVVDVMLMERRPDANVPRAPWANFLLKQFQENRPWDETAREILSADTSDPSKPHRVKFYLERAAEPHLVTRDISRLFLGSNYQCAQCHDHPRIDEYRQGLYYGLFAFVSRTSMVRDNKLKAVTLSEKADGEATYQSVFDPKKVTRVALPAVPGGSRVEEPKLDPRSAYVVTPAAGAAGVPKYSRRLQLAPQIARSDYAPFRRNIANRMWALMMGRGLVEPLDMDHPGNLPVVPELLDVVATELAAHQLDLRWLLREIALSRAYQRSSIPRGEGKGAPYGAVSQVRPLTPEQLAWSLFEATGLTESNRRALGKGLTEAALHSRLAPLVPAFTRTFGATAGNPDSFDARVDQALFLANGPTIRGWLVSRPGTLLARLEALKGDALAEELYLSVLSRRPDAEEKAEVARFLAARPGALADLAWALLASTELRFNH
jgi:hypothetical protein